MTECNVCVESYNKSTRAPITCVKCDFECCKICFKRYITDPEHYLRCMSCSVEFDRSSLHSRLGQTFMRKTYRDIRQLVLYESEKSLFPATQEVIEHELKLRKLRKSRSDLDEEYVRIRRERTIPLKEFRYSSAVMKVSEAIDQYFQLQLNVESVDEQLHEAHRRATEEIELLEENKSVIKRTYVLACTNSKCKGMLSSENKNDHGHYNCSICDSITCHKCKMGIDGENHECDPDVLKNVEFLDSTSKPCPSCGIPIHKISGCSQMFCTSCHASFDWGTLRLNNGAVHNPHRAAWLRANRNRPREVGDIQCGRELDIDIVITLCQWFDYVTLRTPMSDEKRIDSSQQSAYLFEAIRMGIHHTHVTLPALNRVQHGPHTNQRLRIGMLTGASTEAEFKQEIQRRDKAMSKKNDYLHIVMTYRDSLIDIVWQFVAMGARSANKSMDEWLTLVSEVRALEEYVDECFVRVSEAYSCNAHNIMSDRPIR